MSMIRACVPVNTYWSILGTWGFTTEICVIGSLSNRLLGRYAPDGASRKSARRMFHHVG